MVSEKDSFTTYVIELEAQTSGLDPQKSQSLVDKLPAECKTTLDRQLEDAYTEDKDRARAFLRGLVDLLDANETKLDLIEERDGNDLAHLQQTYGIGSLVSMQTEKLNTLLLASRQIGDYAQSGDYDPRSGIRFRSNLGGYIEGDEEIVEEFGQLASVYTLIQELGAPDLLMGFFHFSRGAMIDAGKDQLAEVVRLQETYTGSYDQLLDAVEEREVGSWLKMVRHLEEIDLVLGSKFEYLYRGMAEAIGYDRMAKIPKDSLTNLLQVRHDYSWDEKGPREAAFYEGIKGAVDDGTIQPYAREAIRRANLHH